MMDRALRAARAYAIEHNQCVGLPYGCGEPVAPLVVEGDLRVLVSTAAGADGTQIEAMAFPNQDSYTIWLSTGLCETCQKQKTIRCSKR
jgi:hypothetical protein